MVDMMHDSRLNQKAITWLVSGQHMLNPLFFFPSGDTLSSRLMLHGGAIHRINKSLSCLLMYACLGLNSRRMISSAFLLQTFSPRAILHSGFCQLDFSTKFPVPDRQSVEWKWYHWKISLHAKFECNVPITLPPARSAVVRISDRSVTDAPR